MSLERKWALRVEHILDAIAKIERYVEGLDEPAFAGNSMVVDAVIRNFQVIGEAVRHVPDEVQDRFPEIPWALMRGTRHVIVHGYDVVRLDIIWRTIKVDLPPLVAPLMAALQTARAEEDAAEQGDQI